VSKGNSWEEREARVTSEVARRAIRRLDFLEWVILGAAVAMAVGGGALVAWVLSGSDHPRFRTLWMVTSAVLLIVPGIVVFLRQRQDQRREGTGSEEPRRDDG
jgi:hypothetical protein